MNGLGLVVDNKLRDRVKSMHDLKGMRVGVTSLGSGTHMALNALLNKAGMKPTDIEVTAVGTSTMLPALENGSIQAAVGFDPWITESVSGNRAFLLHDLATEKETLWLYGTYYPFTALVTRPEVIQKKPDLVQRMVNAVLQAHAYIQESDATTIASTLPAEFRSNQEVYLKSLAHSKDTLAPTGVLTTESLEAVLKSMIQSEVLAAGTQIDVASVLDMSLVEKATASK